MASNKQQIQWVSRNFGSLETPKQAGADSSCYKVLIVTESVSYESSNNNWRLTQFGDNKYEITATTAQSGHILRVHKCYIYWCLILDFYMHLCK